MTSSLLIGARISASQRSYLVKGFLLFGRTLILSEVRGSGYTNVRLCKCWPLGYCWDLFNYFLGRNQGEDIEIKH